MSWIFGSKIKSIVRREGGKASGRVELMNCIPLDIASNNIYTLEDAITAFLTPERLTGVTDTNSSSLVKASKHTQLQRLPPVLIFQLKRFGYEEINGNHKLNKYLPFPNKFQLPLDFLVQPNVPAIDRSYTLLAVISHHGAEARRGHYTADIHQHNGSWLTFDDTRIQSCSPDDVLRRYAYLLFYLLDANQQ